MNLVFGSIILLAVANLIVCHLSIGLFLGLIGRALFLFRLLGAVIPIKASIIMEGCNLFCVFIALIFNKGPVYWPTILASVGFSAATILLYFLDNRYYLYVVEDEKEEGDS